MQSWIALVVMVLIAAVGWWKASNRTNREAGQQNGQMRQSFEAMNKRMDKEDKAEANFRESPHVIRADCIKLFNDLNRDLGEIKGSLKTLIEMQKR